MRNLIISAVGNSSLHGEWIKGKANFDLALIYYGNDLDKILQYKNDSKYFQHKQGQKFQLIKDYILANPFILDEYDFVWMPDDDILISSNEINEFFSISHSYNLDLCQPAMKGFLSHKFTGPEFFTFLRFTNFVEVLAPMMSTRVLKKAVNNFDVSVSGWGLEFFWVKVMSSVIKNIAIVDKVVMTHTRPVGTDYSRFPISPMKELIDLDKRFNFGLNFENFKKNFKVTGRVFKLYFITINVGKFFLK